MADNTTLKKDEKGTTTADQEGQLSAAGLEKEEDIINELRIDPLDDCSGCSIGGGKSYMPRDRSSFWKD